MGGRLSIMIASLAVCSAVGDTLPGTFLFDLGEATVTTLAERQQSLSKETLVGATDDMLQRYAPAGEVPNAINAFLVKTGGKRVLVDTGLGLKLEENLKSAGVSPVEIDAVLITHMHRDHIGGLLRGGAPVFTNATLYIPRKEFDYWKAAGAEAQRIADAYAGRLRLFHPQDLDVGQPAPLLQNIVAFAAYGHTPGHTVYLVEDTKKKLLIWGDLTHAAPIQVPHPEVAVTYDVDPAQAVATRKRVLEFAITNKILCVGSMHLAYPGIGHLYRRQDTNTCHLIPVDYTYTNAVSGREIFVRSDGYRTETERIRLGAAKGKVRYLKESHQGSQWWQITENTYDKRGKPVRSVKELYYKIPEKPEVEETVYFPNRYHAHYVKKTGRDGVTRYSVFNPKGEFVATVSGDGKLIKEEKPGNDRYWAQFLQGETPDEARARLLKAEQARQAAERARQDAEKARQAAEDEKDAAAEKVIAVSATIMRFKLPAEIESLFPSNLYSSLPPGTLDWVASMRKAHFESERALMLLCKSGKSFVTNNLSAWNRVTVAVTVSDEDGKPMENVRVNLRQTAMFDTSGSIERERNMGHIPDNWDPLDCTEQTGADGRAVFSKGIGCFNYFYLAGALFHRGKMPEPNLSVSVSAKGYEPVTLTASNVNRCTLACAKLAIEVLAGVAADFTIKASDDLEEARQAWLPERLVKSFSIPAENMHEAVEIKVVLKKI